MHKLLKKYNSASEEMKAAIWYTISNMCQKIAPWLIMFILTHRLSTKDYGVYTIFMSWTEILEIIVTLRIYSNGYVAGLVKENEQKDSYTSTLQKLSYILISFWLVAYILFGKYFNNVLNLERELIILMILSFYGTTSFGLWSSKQRVNNNYKALFSSTILYAIMGPVCGALTVFMNLKNPIYIVIGTRIIIQFIVSVPFFIDNLKGAFKVFDFTYVVETLRYNLPLVPYYLSMVLLNTSDRVMIQKMDGYESAGIYSVAYSISMMIFVISGALNLALQPWLFKKLKNNNDKNCSYLMVSSTLLVTICCLCLVAAAPEIIMIMGGKKYLEAIWIMPPVIISVIVMFIYQQYVNILFFYDKTRYIFGVSVVAAFINIILNYFCIEKYGYFAAGYTTLFSYLIVLILYYFLMKYICSKKNVVSTNYFDAKKQTLILLCAIVFSSCMMLIYDKFVLRYLICFVLLFVIYIKRKWFLSLMRSVKS